jgi:hypothetical protein
MAQEQRDGGAAAGVQGLRAFPPRMTRSQPQLATAYAPGAIFTWEGGKGACLSVPVDGAAIDFSARQTRRDQIIESLQEFCQNWLARGMAINRDAPWKANPRTSDSPMPTFVPNTRPPSFEARMSGAWPTTFRGPA